MRLTTLSFVTATRVTSLKEYFANYFLHMSDITLDMKNNQMKVRQQNAEAWTVTLVDTGEDTQTDGHLK